MQDLPRLQPVWSILCSDWLAAKSAKADKDARQAELALLRERLHDADADTTVLLVGRGSTANAHGHPQTAVGGVPAVELLAEDRIDAMDRPGAVMDLVAEGVEQVVHP